MRFGAGIRDEIRDAGDRVEQVATDAQLALAAITACAVAALLLSVVALLVSGRRP